MNKIPGESQVSQVTNFIPGESQVSQVSQESLQPCCTVPVACQNTIDESNYEQNKKLGNIKPTNKL